MPPSPTLHTLLHALSQAEKRYIRLYAERHRKGEASLSARLMDLFWGQDAFDESVLRASWAEAGHDLQQFAVLKNYVLDLVLQGLRDFHRGKTPRRQAEDLLAEAELLYQRGLLEQAAKSVEKARKMALRYELPGLILQIDALGRNLALRSPADESLAKLAAIAESSDAALTLEAAITRSHALYARLTALTRLHFRMRSPEGRAELGALQANPHLSEALASPHFTPRLHACRTRLLIAQLEGDHDAIWDWQAQLMALWDAFPHMQQHQGAAYVATLVNRLAYCHLTERYPELAGVIALAEAFTPNSPIEQVEVAHNLAYYRLLYRLNVHEWAAIDGAIQELEAVDTAHAALIPAARRLAIRYNIAIAHFVLGQPKAALKAVGQILNLAEKQQRVDLQQAARLLQAVVHYQLGNHDLLDYLLQSLRRYLKTRQGLHAFEEALLAGLKHLLQHPQDRKATMERLLAQLDALKADPVNAQAPGLDELRLWLRAELQGKTLREVFAAQS